MKRNWNEDELLKHSGVLPIEENLLMIKQEQGV